MTKTDVINQIQKNKISLALLMLFSLVSFFIGFVAQKNNSKSLSYQSQLEYSNALELKDQYINSLQLCIENRTSVLDSYTEPYSYKTFGIDSTLLANTEVSVTKYNYCGYTVLEKQILLDEMRVYVTSIENPNQYSKQFSNELIGGTTLLRDIPTFYGYENYAYYARFVSEIAKNWTADESYTNKNGIRSFYLSNYVPGDITSLSAQFYSSFSVMGSALFVDVMQTIDQSSTINGTLPTNTQTAKQELNNFLDTVSLGF